MVGASSPGPGRRGDGIQELISRLKLGEFKQQIRAHKARREEGRSLHGLFSAISASECIEAHVSTSISSDCTPTRVQERPGRQGITRQIQCTRSISSSAPCIHFRTTRRPLYVTFSAVYLPWPTTTRYHHWRCGLSISVRGASPAAGLLVAAFGKRNPY
jgi:hypothetical protein